MALKEKYPDFDCAYDLQAAIDGESTDLPCSHGRGDLQAR